MGSSPTMAKISHPNNGGGGFPFCRGKTMLAKEREALKKVERPREICRDGQSGQPRKKR